MHMNWKKRGISLLCAIGLLLGLLAGCGPANDVTSGVGSTDFPVTINEVTIGQKPEGVAVLSPNLAEVVLALGYEISLKAKTEECTHPDLDVLPNVASDDYEAMKAAGADLALLDEEPTEEQRSAASAAGVTLLAIAPATGREDLARLYSQVGAALNGGVTGYEEGQRRAENTFVTIDDISRVVPATDTPITVCYLLDAEGHAYTGDSLQGKLIESAGLVNAATDSTGNSFPLENLRLANPSYIFCPTGLKEILEQTEGYQELTAVQEGRVYEMDPAWMAYQGDGIKSAVMFMAGTVFPELWETDDPDGTSSASSGSDASSGASSGTSSGAGGTLQWGDEGDEVLRLQMRLQELDYMFVRPTGLYADATEQSVKDFQLINGMIVTGIADPETQALLYSSDAVPRPSS